jgi:glycosyltransferase involved in cell wall biosynthesis
VVKKSRKPEYELVVFSDEWNGLPFSCKHILRHFLPEVPLVWIQTIGLRSPKMTLFDITRATRKLATWITKNEARKDSVSENLFILDPLQIPYNQVKFVREINKRLVIRTLNKFNRNRPLYQRVVITTWPFVGNLIGSLREVISIYYRVDDFSEYPGVNKNYIICCERELMEKVDLVAASARNLMPDSVKGRTVKYLPHGVEYDHFALKTKGASEELPIKKVPRPRIGFLGFINSWVDLELVSATAVEYPNWSFVFIGPSQVPTSSLPKAKNIHFLGPISYDEVPLYAGHFDVGLIPFKTNTLTKSVNPLKLMEYFAMGLPVVSTPLPEVIKYQDHAMIASNPKSFGAAIRTALDHDSDEKRRSRQKLAKTHSWKSRSDQLREWIDEILESRIARAS